MLFSRASNMAVNSKILSLQRELEYIKRSINETSELDKITALYTDKQQNSDESPQAAPDDKNQVDKDGTKSTGTPVQQSNLQQRQQQQQNMKLTAAPAPPGAQQTVSTTASNVPGVAVTAIGPPGNKMFKISIKKGSPAEDGGTFVVEDPNLVPTVNDENQMQITATPSRMQPNGETDLMEALDDLPIEEVHSLAPYADIEIPDGIDPLVDSLLTTIADTASDLPKGRVMVNPFPLPKPAVIKERPIAKISVQDIQVLAPEADPAGISVAGMDNDLALRFL